MSQSSAPRPVKTKDILAHWLHDRFDFTHFVTLASNDGSMSIATMRSRLKQWDARVNRHLYGPNWTKRRDELIWYFAFLEKPGANPHWHLLLRFVGRWNSDLAGEFDRFPALAADEWEKCMPSGTTDVQRIAAERYSTVEDYVVKELEGELQYRHFLVPDEFRTK